LASALWDFWVTRGHHHEWLGRVQDLLARAGLQPSPAYPLARVQGLNTAGLLLWLRGQAADARPLLEAARSLSEASAFTTALARASFYLGLVSMSEGHPTEAHMLLEQSLAHWRALGDRFGCGWALIVLGDIAIEQGDLAGAHALYEDASVLLRALGNRNLLAYALRRLATIALRQSDDAHAIVCCQESLVLNVAVGDKRGIAGSLIGLAAITAVRGQWAGVARPVLPLPLALATMQAWLMEQLPGEPLMSRDNLRSMQTPNVAAPGALSLRDLGITARSLDDYLLMG